ncbi:MAG: DUF4139 domain-containing protein [Proteobacteria bacterium]|nr:DUF4139 domain-containing protein [Pseudomonadota bacterium]
MKAGFTLMLAGLAPLALAADGASRITQVEVYPGVARIERSLAVAAGAREATFACLPAGLDAQSLRASGDAGLRVGELAVRTLPREQVPACTSALQARIDTLEDQLAQVRADATALGYAAGYLGGFAQGERPTGAATIATTVEALRRSGQDVQQRLNQRQREQQALERELAPLRAERDRVAGAGSRVAVVQVTLAAPKAATLRLAYLVRGPGWQPTYRAALDTRSGQLKLTRQALVAQQTGEDWDDVPLRLATGRPDDPAASPLPTPWQLRPWTPQLARPQAAPAPAMAREVVESADAEPMAESAPSFDASVFEGSYATTFVLPQRVRVASGAARITLDLDEQQLAARPVIRTAPQEAPQADLVALFEPPGGTWPRGPLALYRDDAYVGAAQLDLATSARLGLAFGRAPRVQVRVLPLPEQTGSAGFIGSRAQRRTGAVFEIVNGQAEAIALEVLAASPVAGDEAIRVEAQLAPPPTDTGWDERAGVLRWALPLAPGATQRIRTEYLISHPREMQVREVR